MARKEQKIKDKNRILRKARTKKSIASNELMPRLAVFRSLKHFYCQVIDDAQGVTLCSASDKEVKGKKGVEMAQEVGKLVAEKALKKDVKQVVFDRSFYKYHGKVKAAADAAREAGLKF